MINGRGLSVDAATGFLVSKQSITAKQKTDFLEAFRETGSVNAAAKIVGCASRTIADHRNFDNVFAKAYTDIVDYLCNNVEACLYQAAVKSKNVTAMFGFLRAYRSAIYHDGKRQIEHKDTKTDRVRKLLDSLKVEEQLIDVEPTKKTGDTTS